MYLTSVKSLTKYEILWKHIITDKLEVRRQKTEDRRQKTEGRIQDTG